MLSKDNAARVATIVFIGISVFLSKLRSSYYNMNLRFAIGGGIRVRGLNLPLTLLCRIRWKAQDSKIELANCLAGCRWINIFDGPIHARPLVANPEEQDVLVVPRPKNPGLELG